MLRPVRLAALSALCTLVFMGNLSPLAAQDRRVPSSQAELQLSYAPIVQRVQPAVVNVYAAKTVQNRNPFLDDPIFRRFFGVPGQQPEQMQRSLGSGVMVDGSGLVVTNNHVIEGADQVKVSLSDKREFEAEIVLKDSRTDLAVLRLKGTNKEKFTTLDFANSDQLQVGDVVLAIGNPFGVGQTVTHGIISALARTQVGITDYQFFIQTDAAINPGNSGGALVDMDAAKAGKTQDSGPGWDHIRQLLANRMMLGVYIGQYCINTLTYFFLTWFPVYLVKERGLSILQAGFVATLPALCGFIGGVLGGVFVDDRRDPQQRVTIVADHGTVLKNESGSYLVLEDGNLERFEAGKRDPTLVVFQRYAFDMSKFSQGRDVTLGIRERYLWELMWPDENDQTYQQLSGQFFAELHDRFMAPIYPFAFAALTFAFLGAPRTTRQSRNFSIGGSVFAVFGLRMVGFACSVMAVKTPIAALVQYLMLFAGIGVGLWMIIGGVVVEPPPRLMEAINRNNERIARLFRRQATA